MVPGGPAVQIMAPMVVTAHHLHVSRTVNGMLGTHDVRPNILFVMADDHAAHAISAYGSRISQTPAIDRIAREGMRFDACFCTNSLCSPSRATILTGTYNHVNGVTSNSSAFDARQPTFVSALRAAGYQTYLVGKWHLGHGGIHDPWRSTAGASCRTTAGITTPSSSSPRASAWSATAT